jgi:hypothetical protein
MDLTTIIKAFLDPSAEHAPHPFSTLRPGDPLTGKVLRIAEDGRVLMDFGRFRANARIEWSVNPGQTIDLEVVEAGMPLKLRMRSTPGSPVKSFIPRMDLRHALPPAELKRLLSILDHFIDTAAPATRSQAVPQGIRSAMNRLCESLQPLTFSGAGGTDELVLRLRRIIDASGLFFERKLAETVASDALPENARADAQGTRAARVIASDLKAQLLQLKTFYTEAEAKVEQPMDLSNREVAFLRRSVDQLLTHIHDQSGRVLHMMGDDHPMAVVHHQVEIKDFGTPLKLKVYYPKKRRHGQTSGRCRLAMLLDMDRLGPVRIDLAVFEDALDICFFVRSEPVRQKLESACDPLIAELKGSFGRVQIAVRVSRQKIDRFEGDDHSRSGTGWIDIQI